MLTFPGVLLFVRKPFGRYKDFTYNGGKIPKAKPARRLGVSAQNLNHKMERDNPAKGEFENIVSRMKAATEIAIVNDSDRVAGYWPITAAARPGGGFFSGRFIPANGKIPLFRKFSSSSLCKFSLPKAHGIWYDFICKELLRMASSSASRKNE